MKPRSKKLGKLSQLQFFAYEAGYWHAARERWMQAARHEKKELRDIHVRFARNAHKNYRRWMKSALEIQV